MSLGNWEGGGGVDAACHEARASEPISRETCLPQYGESVIKHGFRATRHWLYEK